MVVDEEPSERATIDPSGVMAAAAYEPLIMSEVVSDNELIELSNERMGEGEEAQTMVVAPEDDCEDAARLEHATESGIDEAATNWLVLESQP